MLGLFRWRYRQHVRQNKLLRKEIQERERAEESLRKSQDALMERERLRALGEMAAGVAHDINNAMMPIVAFSEILVATPDLPAEVQELGKTIYEGALDASEIIRRIQPLYRGKQAKRQSVDLQSLIETTAGAARNVAETNHPEKRITITTDTTSISAVVAQADLREILLNLTYNAMDAIVDQGSVCLRCHQTQQYIVIEVADTGVGMSSEVRMRCMESFYSTKGDEGSGLGLATSQAIISTYGGKILVESDEGEGSVFQVHLPIELSPDALPIVSSHSLVPLPKLRILIVDDVEGTRKAILRQLESLEQEVSACSNANDALEYLKTKSFDLVMTDYSMPEVNGLELCRRFEECGYLGPVVFITSSQKPKA